MYNYKCKQKNSKQEEGEIEMKNMKVYAVVGHFKGCENMKAVAMKCNNKKILLQI